MTASPVAPGAHAAQPLIELQAAGVAFGRTVALQPTDFQIRRGERVALIGANGSGKTTLLRLLHGQLEPTCGTRRAHADANGQPLRQAMLFQRPFLLRLSVWRNLQVALWLAGVPRGDWDQRGRHALERVGLAGLQRRPARVLSGGQQQRLALARAWAVRPQMLLLDEPTASLDPGGKHEVETLIDEFAREGMAVVMSTHNLGQAKRLSSRVVFLDAGRIACDLPTDGFFNQRLPEAAHHFVRGEAIWS
jgi:tungstate transport system ATP-binding protein